MDSISLVITVFAAFIFTSIQGIWVIPFLKKLKYGQTILEDGPTWHKAKQGTPTMGGIMFIFGSIIAAAAGYALFAANGGTPNNANTTQLVCGISMAVGFGIIGFLDDYIKVVKKRNLGLRAGQKMLLQLILGVVYIAVLAFTGNISTAVAIPFLGQLELGILYYPFALFIVVGVTNAVNLTDGIDGLCSSVTFVAALGFMIISAMLGNHEMNLMAAALAGATLGFLCWNFHPAKVFMGDTGSMFLGGMVVALSFGTKLQVFLLLIGIIYMMETLSVILQVASFKLTGKRIFKMSPIHHHFEMTGWSEVKIVTVFSLITALGCALAVAAVAVM